MQTHIKGDLIVKTAQVVRDKVREVSLSLEM